MHLRIIPPSRLNAKSVLLGTISVAVFCAFEQKRRFANHSPCWYNLLSTKSLRLRQPIGSSLAQLVVTSDSRRIFRVIMADEFDASTPTQDPDDIELGRMEWLYGTLDNTAADAGRGGPRRVPFWTCLTFVVGVLVVVGVLALLLGPALPAAPAALATETATPDVAATALAQATPKPTNTPFVPEATATPTPTRSGIFEVGDRVAISGTGARGLRLRAGPGLSYLTVSLAKDGQVFFIMPGNGDEPEYPVKADGYTWWRLRSTGGDLGWTVQNYLAPAPLLTPTPSPTAATP